jgi:hypothetical protein
MTTKNFNVKKGITTGNVRLDANTGNIVGSNVNASSLVTTLDLEVTGNLRSNLRPNANGVLSLGNSSARYKDLYLSNVVYINDQSISANATTTTISGNLQLTDANIGNVAVANANIAYLETANIVGNIASFSNVTIVTFAANQANVNILAANVITANTGNITNLNVSNTIVANKIEVDLVEGNIFRANSANIKTIISDQITVNNQIIINSTTQATSTTTGSFVTAGGAAIGKDLYVGGSIHLANGNGGTTSKGIINYNDGVNSIDFGFNNT